MWFSPTLSEGRPRWSSWRVALLVGLSVPIFGWAISSSPLPQDLTYHDFADQRVLLGIPHFWNVLSNLPFAVIGLLGCWWLYRGDRMQAAFEDPGERVAYFVFFFGEFLTCFGSGYYHASPTNETLVWDRLVFSLMLTSIFAIVVTEFVNRRVGRVMLVPMVVLGVFSVLYWARTEALGQGDLRLYYLVQFYPMLAIPVILLVFQSRYTHAKAFWLMWALYALAKVAEIYDEPIFRMTEVWSGHTVKHFVAAGASAIPLFGLRRRMRAGGGARLDNVSILSVKALLVAFLIAVVGSLVALMCVVMLSQVMRPVHQLWFIGLMLVLMFSVMGGLAVARVARRNELTHALIVAVAFMSISLSTYPGTEFNHVAPGGVAPGIVPLTPAWHDMAVYALILATLPAALLGGYVARTIKTRTQGVFMSRFTYGAMTVWGIVETVDSLGGFMGSPWLFISMGIIGTSAMLLSCVSSMWVIFCGPREHRRRVLAWYGLLVPAAALSSVGWIVRPVSEIAMAAIAMRWLMQAIGETPIVNQKSHDTVAFLCDRPDKII